MSISHNPEQYFDWTCPSEGCRHVQTECVNELGPAMTLVCGACDQWFGEKDLRPEDAAAWADAFRKVSESAS